MRRTGRRSSTEPAPRLAPRGRRPASAALAFVAVLVLAAPAARALDIFTLWRQPEAPLRLEAGAWADYRTQVMAGGRRETGISRIACLGRESAAADAPWILELVPLSEAADGKREPVAGEGVRLRVDPGIAARTGTLLDHVLEARHWRDGAWQPYDREDLRRDPLLASSLDHDFLASEVTPEPPTTRIVAGRELLCDQFALTAADTQTAELPAGRMIQVTTREVSAAVNAEIPFLGLAYVAERVRSESRLDPPSRRFRDPAAQIRVEVMELVGYGRDAKPLLGAQD